MAIEFVCPTCNGALQVSDDAAGRVIRCGGCLTMLRVPGDSTPPGDSAPASPFETEPSQPPPSRRSRSSTQPQRRDDSRRRSRDRDRDRDRDDYGDDYYDRPRRRLPEASSSGAGRSTLLWVAGIGGVLFLGLIGCCVGMFAILPKEDWHNHESKQGGFKVEMPTKTKRGIEKDAGINLKQDSQAEGAMLFPQQYMVIHRNIDSTKERAGRGGEQRADEKELDDAVAELLRATEGPPRTPAQDLAVDGFPARELTYDGKGGKIFTARVIVADTKRYIVLSCGPLPDDNPNVRRFIESFHVTDPKLVARGKELEKQAGAKKREKDNGNGKANEDDP